VAVQQRVGELRSASLSGPIVALAARPIRGGRGPDHVVARNIANEDHACGYARAHNSHLYPACSKGGPLRLIGAERAAVEVRDIDRFPACGRCGERQNCNQQKSPGSHRPAPFSRTADSTGRAAQGLRKAPASTGENQSKSGHNASGIVQKRGLQVLNSLCWPDGKTVPGGRKLIYWESALNRCLARVIPKVSGDWKPIEEMGRNFSKTSSWPRRFVTIVTQG
jgi:hypothetical protein